jgi:hypothetical protein
MQGINEICSFYKKECCHNFQLLTSKSGFGGEVLKRCDIKSSLGSLRVLEDEMLD